MSYSPRILFLTLEFETWPAARALSYTGSLGFEEGFAANRVKFVTLTTPCFRWAQDICKGLQFDQVWVYAVQSRMTEAQQTWIAGLAPVRVGIVGESLGLTDEELKLWPWLAKFREEFHSWLPSLSHVIAFDERVAELARTSASVKAIWVPSAVPARFVARRPPLPRRRTGLFSGTLYEWRKHLVEHPDLQGLLRNQRSPEHNSPLPKMFAALQTNVQRYLNRSWLPCRRQAVSHYMMILRAIRRYAFWGWIRSLQSGAAVVNLPSYFQSYSGRVVEGMAAGRPVVSWQIPGAPLNAALFRDNEDILLFPRNDPERLAHQLRRLLNDFELAKKLVDNARAKILRHHTVEHRVRQILDWIETGVAPTYG